MSSANTSDKVTGSIPCAVVSIFAINPFCFIYLVMFIFAYIGKNVNMIMVVFLTTVSVL